MATLLRATRAAPRMMRAGAGRRMCTAVAEEVAEAGPFSPSKPHNQMFYAVCGVTYLFTLKWQAGDRKLAKEIAEHKAAHATEEPVVTTTEVVVEATPTPAAPSAVVAAVTAAAAPPTAGVAAWKVADVCAWLDTIELGEHGSAFKTHSINGKMLLALSDQDLYASLNIVSPLHRKKLLMEIASLRKAYLNP
uniref:SAM domain-containing protein n=1 Tax=Haptolina brevifila TaxID=156173 RepID=A0A7S2NIP7_9EUKA|mmetsp:Transcript_78635/g.156316  ORF Transcript_78635/g.156316 Transcript_78635/m.156316 type:complete len:192 (+) Transcript_78635:21-596(+)